MLAALIFPEFQSVYGEIVFNCLLLVFVIIFVAFLIYFIFIFIYLFIYLFIISLFIHFFIKGLPAENILSELAV